MATTAKFAVVRIAKWLMRFDFVKLNNEFYNKFEVRLDQKSFLYTPLVKIDSILDGCDNVGIGQTLAGERYVLKQDPEECVAEVIGYKCCSLLGIPVAPMQILTFNDHHYFGSRYEYGVVQLELHNVANYAKDCSNKVIFTLILALDLCLGNDDRHWRNWLVQKNQDEILFRAIDFGRGWPASAPCELVDLSLGQTGNSRRMWEAFGLEFEKEKALIACEQLGGLSDSWLDGVLRSDCSPSWCDDESMDYWKNWWRAHWSERVGEVIRSIQQGDWK